MTIEVQRIELPVKEGHRGRKPCEWRIGDFVIPKSLTCVECNEPKATTKDQFVKLIEKSGSEPEELVNVYICRSCRKEIRDEENGVHVETEESDIETQTRFPTRKRIMHNYGLQFGLIVKDQPVIFYILQSEFEQGPGFTMERSLNPCSEAYDLTRRLCLKHPKDKVLPKQDVTDHDKRVGMNKFSELKTMFNFEDMNEICKSMLNGGLTIE